MRKEGNVVWTNERGASLRLKDSEDAISCQRDSTRGSDTTDRLS